MQCTLERPGLEKDESAELTAAGLKILMADPLRQFKVNYDTRAISSTSRREPGDDLG